MFGFGGNTPDKSDGYGGPGEGAGHFGGGGLGTPSGSSGNKGGGQNPGGLSGNTGNTGSAGTGNTGNRAGGGQNVGGASSSPDRGAGVGGAPGRQGGTGQDVGNRAAPDPNRGSVGLGGPSRGPSYGGAGGNLNTNREAPGNANSTADADIGRAALSGFGRGGVGVDTTGASARTGLDASRVADLSRSLTTGIASGAPVPGDVVTRHAVDASTRRAYRDAIASIESLGMGGYKALGQKQDNGDQALGRYQVMASNVPSWTKQVLGTAMTPQGFLNDPKAQDKVFDAIFGGYVDKYGLNGAARAWFGGEAGMSKLGNKDSVGTTVGGYGKQFEAALNKSLRSGQRAYDPASGDAKSFADKYLNNPGHRHVGGATSEHQAFGDDVLGPYTNAGYSAHAYDATGKTPSTPTAGVAGNQPEGPQPGTEYPDRPRSTGEKVVGGVIDAGIGLVSPVAGLANTGLGLVGSRTAGTRVVDYLASLGGSPGDYKFNDQTGSGGEAGVKHFADKYLRPTTPPTTTDEDTTSTLDDREITSNDRTKRPTPHQKYDLGRLTFGLGG